MYIKALELSNVKSYRHQRIRFREGTNIIAGSNGAGKTTIVESIGYALFDHNPYKKKEDFLRHGEKSGSITVTVVAGDEREYQVVRQLGRNTYYVYDPVLDRKLDLEGKGEVLAWLIRNLGLGEGELAVEELSSLFRNAVGVEQGLMTAPFLETTEERKRKFMPLLRVDGYKKAYIQSAKLGRVLRDQMTEQEKRLEWMAGKLQDYESKAAREKELKLRLRELESALSRLEQDREEKKEQKEQMDELRKELDQTRQLLKAESALLAKLREDRVRALKEQEEAGKALELVENSREDHLRFLKLEKHLQALQKQKDRKTGLREEQQGLQGKLGAEKRSLQELEERLDRAKKAAQERKTLEPHRLKEQEQKKALDRQKEELVRLEQETHFLKQKERGLEKRRTELAQTEKELVVLEELKRTVDTIPKLQQNLEEWEAKRAGFQARLEQEQKKAEQLGKGECPFFQEPCPKVEGDLGDFQASLEKQKHSLNQELEASVKKLKELRQRKLNAGKAGDRYQRLLSRQDQAKEQAARIRKETEAVEEQKARLGSPDELKKSQKSAEEALSALRAQTGQQDISRHCHLLDEKAAETRTLEKRKAGLETTMQTLDAKLGELELRLARFKDVDTGLQENSALLEELKPAHYNYSQNLKIAEQNGERKERLALVEGELGKKQEDVQARKEQLAGLKEEYKQEAHRTLEEAFNQTQKQLYTVASERRIRKGVLEELSIELKELRTLEQDRGELKRKLKEDKSLNSFLDYIRDQVLKKAPEALVRVYLERINWEANRLFQELIGNPMVELSWSETFEVTVREGPNTRIFRQLSGGQQMCAALAVRLALLRSLSSIGVAFFDEPTQNLDGERRRYLADAVRNISGFSQLFIISHDETFHDLVDNTIYLEMKDGETVVGDGLG